MTYTVNANATEGLFAIIGGMLIIIALIAIAVAVVTIIGLWKVFTKAGEEGWKAIIPIYNVYTLCKITGVNPYWILIVFVSSFVSFIPIIGSLLQLAVSVYFGILLAKSTANSFEKDTAFAVGLYFLSPIFYCILGFGDAKYVGAKPMDDIIFKNNK